MKNSNGNGREPIDPDELKDLAQEKKKMMNEILRDSMAAGNWFHFRKDYVRSRIMDREEALFIQDIINHVVYHNNVPARVDYEGNVYFLCTTKYLENSLGWDRNTQGRLLRKLKRKGFIFTHVAGLPARRYIFVDLVKIEKLIYEWRNNRNLR